MPVPLGQFKLLLGAPCEQIIMCTVSGRIRKNFVRIVVGDSVQVELSAYDLNQGRIIFRRKVA
jgi:translation initiation factor IF-1